MKIFDSADEIENSMEKDVKEKTEKPKKKPASKKVQVKKPDDSKHIKNGICQICGANIGKGKPHSPQCKLK